MSELPEVKITQITDNIYKILVKDYVNLIAFGGPDGILLIDSGFKETAHHLGLKLREMWNNDIKYIINTHSDRDHCGGNLTLGRHATILAHRNCWKLLSKNKSLEKALVITFEDSLSLFFNSEELRLISLTGCHSGEDIIVHFKGANIVFLGDIIISDSFPFVRLERGGSIKKLLENL
ncbi:MAG: MBL fold metallo-hydrolase, partial [Theionarchaea archaeon]|nr:MBL fold metallo-hydrolase [Theionarchaea archaeon]